MFDPEQLWPQPRSVVVRGEMAPPKALRLERAPGAFSLRAGRAEELRRIARVEVTDERGAYPLALIRTELPGTLPGSYELSVTPEGASIRASDAAGAEYGMETLLQAVALAGPGSPWPLLTIADSPQYRTRCFMVDLGRSVFPLRMLERIVRILARLKMNQLHLHLHDDELCGIRYPGLPFGEENPFALSVDELARLVRYAASYHVEVVPELEAWGHVGSLTYHRPELRGGEGMYQGASFLISEGSFGLVESLLDRLVPALAERSTVHLGLDEAQWFCSDELGGGFTPERMVGRYHDLLREVGRRHGRELTLRLWADHAGRPVPESIRPQVIIEPWQYWIAQREAIDKAIERYSAGPTPWIMGAGQSSQEFRGAYHATRYWCRRAAGSPGVQGVNVTFWGSNDLARNLITLFSGAFWAWNPLASSSHASVDDYEMYDRAVFPIMRRWQLLFPDAYPDDMLRDQGPEVSFGYYVWGERHGEPVAPTAPLALTTGTLDYLHRRPARWKEPG